MHLPIKMMREDKWFPSKKEFTDHVKLIKTASLNSLDGFAFGKMQMCYVLVFFCFSAFKVFKNSLTQEVSAFFLPAAVWCRKGFACCSRQWTFDCIYFGWPQGVSDKVMFLPD